MSVPTHRLAFQPNLERHLFRAFCEGLRIRSLSLSLSPMLSLSAQSMNACARNMGHKDDEAALLRALRCFQLGDEIQAAKTEAAQANQSARRKGKSDVDLSQQPSIKKNTAVQMIPYFDGTGGGREGATGGPDAVQLLNLTLSCLDARSASDKAGASEGPS